MILATPQHTFAHGNTDITVFHADMGCGLPMHRHTYKHATICCNGEIAIRLRGKEVVLGKNSRPVVLPANEEHEIEATQDGTVFINIVANEEDKE
jgi:quercetin dioxygenase-like cupin family protein